MKILAKKSILSCLGIAIAVLILLPGSSTAEEVFRGKLMTAGGPIQQKMVTVKIHIKEFSTPDDIRALRKTLLEDGSDEFMKAFRKSNKGFINFIGVEGVNIRINTAQVFPTYEGRKLLMFCERQSWGGTQRSAVYRNHFFMAIELELNNEGKGTGIFYPGCSLQMDAKGVMALDGFLPTEQILGIRKIK